MSLAEPYDIAISLKNVEKETLSDELTYRILKTHFKAYGDITFPKTDFHGCNRLCSLNYLNNLFVYTTSSDSVFCIHCALFVSQEKRKNLNTFVNACSSHWHNIIERQSIYVERKYHKDVIKDSHNLINHFEKPEGTTDYHLDTIYRERCNKYPKILEFIARAIHFHGLRGQRETLQESDENQNLGNFLTCLKELQSYCPKLKKHLEAPQTKSVTYLSPTSQNEIIEVIGKKTFLRDTVEEIKNQDSTAFLQTR